MWISYRVQYRMRLWNQARLQKWKLHPIPMYLNLQTVKTNRSFCLWKFPCLISFQSSDTWLQHFQKLFVPECPRYIHDNHLSFHNAASFHSKLVWYQRGDTRWSLLISGYGRCQKCIDHALQCVFSIWWIRHPKRQEDHFWKKNQLNRRLLILFRKLPESASLLQHEGCPAAWWWMEHFLIQIVTCSLFTPNCAIAEVVIDKIKKTTKANAPLFFMDPS